MRRGNGTARPAAGTESPGDRRRCLRLDVGAVPAPVRHGRDGGRRQVRAGHHLGGGERAVGVAAGGVRLPPGDRLAGTVEELVRRLVPDLRGAGVRRRHRGLRAPSDLLLPPAGRGGPARAAEDDRAAGTSAASGTLRRSSPTTGSIPPSACRAPTPTSPRWSIPTPTCTG